MNDMTVEERVANGIEWLDEHAPAEWWNLIDLAFLEIADAEACVLGQIFASEADAGGYLSGYHFAESIWGELESGAFQAPRGFLPYEGLEAAWILAIEDRRALVNA